MNNTKNNTQNQDDDKNMVVYWKNEEYNPLSVSWSISNSTDYSDGLTKLLDHYEGQWPPRTSYEKTEWPSSWHFYLETVDIMCSKLCSFQDIFTYRQWLTDRFNNHFTDSDDAEFEQVILSIYREINSTNINNKHSRILYGFLGCITKLCHSYRWGIAPLTGDTVLFHKEYELEYGLIKFPKFLIEPWYIINNFYGLPMSGTTASILYANIHFNDNYDEFLVNDIKQRQEQISIRYFWTDDKLYPQERETENNSFMLFAQSVVKTQPLMQSVADALDFVFKNCTGTKSENAKIINSTENEIKYIELLDAVEKAYVATTDHFGKKLKTINGKMYIENVSGLAAWNLGARGGASGAEQFLSQIIDRFLLIDTTNLEARNTMLSTQRALIQKLEKTVQKRQQILPIELCSNKIKKKFYRIISRVRGWRINHRNKIHEILKLSKAKQSATGNLQVDVTEDDEGIKCPFGHKKTTQSKQDSDISDAFFKSMTKNVMNCEKIRDLHYNYKDNGNKQQSMKMCPFAAGKNMINKNIIQWMIIVIMVLANIYALFC